jgi:hypothetical protein
MIEFSLLNMGKTKTLRMRALVGILLLILTTCSSPVAKGQMTAESTSSTDRLPQSSIGSAPHVATSTDATENPWRPTIGSSWQWQLDELPIDQSVDGQVYDIDLFDNDAGTVAALHAQGRKVICYFSAGSWEDWRPDKDQFPANLIGRNYSDWAGEKWLDIRQIDQLAPILRARLDLCKAKGYDAVEPDNIDGYANATGFPLTAADQLRFNSWLAGEAHQRGLSIGLKNDPEQAAELESYFDWALSEDCFAEGWCEQMLPFIKAGKAVFSAEYTDTGITLDKFCSQADQLHFSAIFKHRDLGVYRSICP